MCPGSLLDIYWKFVLLVLLRPCYTTYTSTVVDRFVWRKGNINITVSVLQYCICCSPYRSVDWIAFDLAWFDSLSSERFSVSSVFIVRYFKICSVRYVNFKWAEAGEIGPWRVCLTNHWLHGTAVERSSLTGEFSQSCVWPAADG